MISKEQARVILENLTIINGMCNNCKVRKTDCDSKYFGIKGKLFCPPEIDKALSQLYPPEQPVDGELREIIEDALDAHALSDHQYTSIRDELMEELQPYIEQKVEQAKRDERELYHNLIDNLFTLIDHADFRNDNTWSGIDEGQVLADGLINDYKTQWQSLKTDGKNLNRREYLGKIWNELDGE
jgi:hypothetical protein